MDTRQASCHWQVRVQFLRTSRLLSGSSSLPSPPQPHRCWIRCRNVVSHSQGCSQTRNRSILAMPLFEIGDKVMRVFPLTCRWAGEKHSMIHRRNQTGILCSKSEGRRIPFQVETENGNLCQIRVKLFVCLPITLKLLT